MSRFIPTIGVLLLSLLPVGASQQPADRSAAGTSAISGVVMDAATKQPVAGALVSLSVPASAAERPNAQLTDARGRFVFPNLAAAPNYTLTADRPGYLPAPYSRRPDPGASATPIAVNTGEWVSDLPILLWRRSALTGVVTDERGEPVADIFVRAMMLVRLHGHDRLVAGPLTTTDDRGIYRLSDLMPGRYLVHVPAVHATAPSAMIASSISPAGVRTGAPSLAAGPAARLVLNQYPTPPPLAGGRPRAYTMTFHPSARGLADAQVIALGAGEERTADVRIEPVEVVRIAGRVDGPAESLTALTLRLVPASLDTLGPGSEAATSLVAPDGTFAFANVPAGAYTIDAPRVVTELTANRTFSPRMILPRPPGRGGWSSWSQAIDMASPGLALSTLNYRGSAPNYFARTSIEIDDADRTDVVVTMRAAGTLSGRVVAEPEGTRPDTSKPPRGDVFLESASAALGPARLAADVGLNQPAGQFSIQGVLPGSYWLRYRDPGGWIVKTIMWRGRDYTDVPFDGSAGEIGDVVVTITPAAPVLTGTVRDSSGNTAPGATVLAFPSDRTLWSNTGLFPTRIRTAVAATNGVYRLTALPAGDYLIVATEGTSTAGSAGPDFLQAAERVATRRTLTWGQTHAVDLVAGEVR